MDATQQAERYSPDFAGLVRLWTAPQPADDEQATARTTALMSRFVIEDSQSPIIRRAASAAVSSAGTPREELSGIFDWIKGRVRFQEDAELARSAGIERPHLAEVLVRPVDLLTMPQPAGDCDDFAMLTAAMLRARGIPAEFVTVAADPEAPDAYSHVYVHGLVAGERIPLDTSHGPRPGWEAPARGKRRSWPIEENPMQLGGLGYEQATFEDLMGTSDWAGNSSSWLKDLITGAAQTGEKILTAQYAQPPAGTYVRKADGSMYYQGGGGSSALPAALTATSGNSGWFVLAAAAVVLVLVLRK